MESGWKAAGAAVLVVAVTGGGLIAVRGDRASAPPVVREAAAAPAAVLPAAPAAPDAAAPLQAQAQAIVGSASGDWTIMAWSFEKRQTLFAINAAAPKVPASNNKVYSSIWALELLGPDYRFPTDLLITAPIENGVVRGDVVLRGSGDPGFGYPQYDKDPLKSPRIMAQALKKRGVRVIEGGVLADASIHDDRNFGPAWPLDTGNGVSAYAPTVSGLPFQRNMLWVSMVPDSATGRPFTTIPETTAIPVVWERRSGRGYAVRKPDEDTVRVRGAAGGRGARYGVGVAEPALLAGSALREALVEEGIEVRGGVQEGKTPKGARLVHRHFSLTLGEMLPQLNKNSDNFFAEHFWKAASAKAIGVGSYDRGPAASAAFFQEKARVPRGQIWQADGSGLSSENHTSAHAMVSALSFAHQRPWKQVFFESLAVAGDPDGTMKRMFNGMPAEGKLHAKTGYIRGVRSLSGYVKAPSGETIMFAFIYNGRNTGGARNVQVQLGNLLATYGG